MSDVTPPTPGVPGGRRMTDRHLRILRDARRFAAEHGAYPDELEDVDEAIAAFGAECAECARLREALRWWDAAILYPPFTPDGNGGNDGIVRDANGGFVADTRGFEARADVIAELLNRAALRAPSTQREE